MKLIGYFRSSAAFRVRIALNLKGIAVEHASRHLRKGEQRAPDYVAINPQKLVPALVLDAGEVLTQSLAILEYLEETHPDPPLLPNGSGRPRARARAGADPDRRHPSDPEPARDGLSAREVRPVGGGDLRLVAPLDRDRLRRLRGIDRRQPPHRHLQPRRPADHGRPLPGAAGLQRRSASRSTWRSTRPSSASTPPA